MPMMLTKDERSPIVSRTTPTESIENDRNNDTSSMPNRISRHDLPATTSVQPSFYWTWQLIVDGYSIEHISQTRGIERSAIFDHANRAIESGRSVQVGWLLDAVKVSALQRLIQANPNARISALMSELPTGIEAFELQFFLKANDASVQT